MTKKKTKKEEIDLTEYEAVKKDYTQLLLAAQSHSIHQFDTQILYVSSGTLLLSISFIGDVVKLSTASWTWVLFTSWILLGATVLLSVFSQLISYNQHNEAIERLENDEDPLDDKLMPRLNLVMAISLAIGVCLLIVFAIKNISDMKESNNSNSKNEVRTIRDSTTTSPNGDIEKLGSPVQIAPKALLIPKDTIKPKNK